MRFPSNMEAHHPYRHLLPSDPADFRNARRFDDLQVGGDANASPRAWVTPEEDGADVDLALSSALSKLCLRMLSVGQSRDEGTRLLSDGETR